MSRDASKAGGLSGRERGGAEGTVGWVRLLSTPAGQTDLPSTLRPDADFDFSTPEGEAAIRVANAMVLEITRPLARRVDLYERTLGIAVIPVLIRRAILDRWNSRRSG